MFFWTVFWTVIFFVSITDALKLSLKQDLNQLQEQLTQEEIGQFLHTIKDLPKLAEYLDPIRSPIHFDLLFYYNEYGCKETRIFDMDRIGFIMSYGQLSREDKLILLNGSCMINWPGLLKIRLSDLLFILEMFPEVNPLLQLNKNESYEYANAIFEWDHLKTDHPDRFFLFLDNAAKHREEFDFIDAVENLFRWKLVNPFDFPAISDRIHLIGPLALGECMEANLASTSRKRLCADMILARIGHDYDNNIVKYSALDSFYMGLNIVSIFKYTNEKLSSSAVLKSHLKRLLKYTPKHQTRLIAFLTKFYGLFCEFFDTREINNEIIAEMIEELTKFEQLRLHVLRKDQSHKDAMKMAVEFYKWLVYNTEFFEIKQVPKSRWFKIIKSDLETRLDPKNRDYFMKFLAYSKIGSSAKTFKKFIENNYESDKPSRELLKVYRKLSWIGYKDKVNFLKQFLPSKLRLLQLKRISYSHNNQIVTGRSKIDINFDEDVSLINNLFDGVFNSVLENDLLVHPLEVSLTASPTVMTFLKDRIDLESVILRLWKFLGEYNNGFFKFNIDYDGDDIDDSFPIQFTPLPWIHPNVLIVVGCVMTLAMLHGIKLTGWSINKEFFNSAFDEINLEPLLEDHSSDSMYFDEEGNFLYFYSLNEYSYSIKKEQKKRKNTTRAEEMMSSQYGKLSDFTKICLNNYNKKELDSDTGSSFDFSANRSEEVKIAKLFRMIQAETGESYRDFDCTDDASLRSSLHEIIETATEDIILFKRYSFVEQLTADNDDEMEEDWEHGKENLKYTKEMFKLQPIALFLGIQPMTRYLTSEEAYKLIFYSE